MMAFDTMKPKYAHLLGSEVLAALMFSQIGMRHN